MVVGIHQISVFLSSCIPFVLGCVRLCIFHVCVTQGRLPRGTKSWPCDDISDVQTNKRFLKKALSDFATQVLRGDLGFSVSEAKVVAQTLLRCADFASRVSESVTG